MFVFGINQLFPWLRISPIVATALLTSTTDGQVSLANCVSCVCSDLEMAEANQRTPCETPTATKLHFLQHFSCNDTGDFDNLKNFQVLVQPCYHQILYKYGEAFRSTGRDVHIFIQNMKPCLSIKMTQSSSVFNICI